MDILTYMIPGIPMPLVAIACFAWAALAFCVIRGLAGDIFGLAATGIGTALAIIGSADLLLLVAMELMLLCGYLGIAGWVRPKKDKEEGQK